MKSRILSIVLALSMLAVAFAAVPTHAAVNYTGTVRTTDDTSTPKTVYFEYSDVYVNISLYMHEEPYVGDIYVELWNANGGVVDWFYETTDNPVDGIYDSVNATTHRTLWIGGIGVDLAVYTIVVYVDNGMWWEEFARTQVQVMNEGLFVDPDPTLEGYYYPGEDVTISLATTHTTEVFYVQVLNETDDETGVNWTGQVAIEGWWNVVWTIPSTFPDGAYHINVRSADDHSIWYATDPWYPLVVQKFVLMIQPERYNYLIGEQAKIDYAVIDVKTMGYASGIAIEWREQYYNSTDDVNLTNKTGVLNDNPGTMAYDIPLDIGLYSDVWFTFWANETGTERSYEAWVTLYIGLVQVSMSVSGTTFSPGDMVMVSANTWVSWSNLPGATVNITVEWNGTAIDAYAASGLESDLNGGVSHAFRLADDAAKGSYVVKVTAEKLGYSANVMGTFNVDWSGDLIVQLDKTYYYGGETATVHFKPIWNNKVVDTATIMYRVSSAIGMMATGNSTGEDVEFAIPSTYYGWITVYAAANFNGYFFENGAGAEVVFAEIALTTENSNYRPGETVTFVYSIVTGLDSADLTYEIWDGDGVKVETSDISPYRQSGSFAFDVPATHASDEYDAVLIMTDGKGGYADARATVDMMPSYELMIWVKKSGYASGEFKPGTTAKIGYKVGAYVYDQLPLYRIDFWVSGDPNTYSVLVTDPEGTLTYDIPKDAPAAELGVGATLYDGAGGPSLSSDYSTITVNNRLSAWDRSVGGMSLIDFVLLLLIVILIIVLILMPFVKAKMAAGPKTEPLPPPPTEVKK